MLYIRLCPMQRLHCFVSTTTLCCPWLTGSLIYLSLDFPGAGAWQNDDMLDNANLVAPIASLTFLHWLSPPRLRTLLGTHRL